LIEEETGKIPELKPTPVVYDKFLDCFLKLESDNPSGSHKDRETLFLTNKFGRDKRYIVISTGNAAISLAYWMKEKATVLMPEITSRNKIDEIKRYGANVIIRGRYYYDSYRVVDQIAKQMNLVNISPGFVDRWKGDIGISYELQELQPEYVFVPSANHTLAYGIAFGFQQMLDQNLIASSPTVVSCVVPNHPFVHLAEDITDEFKRHFSSIYTHGGKSESLEKRFLNFTFTKCRSTLELDSVLKLEERYTNYDSAVLLAMYISQNYIGKKVVIVTGIKRG